MNILLISTHDRGGAGLACIRLHKGLLSKRLQSKIIFKERTNLNIPESYNLDIDYSNIPITKRLKTKTTKILEELKIIDKSKKREKLFLSNRLKGLEGFSFPNSAYDLTNSSLFRKADIVNLHWVSNFIDYEGFFNKCNKPIVWTLHDMNPFSGGEHYTEQYLGIDNRGYPIPRMISIQEKNQFNEIIKLKEKALKRFDNLHIVALSNWMASEAKRSTVFARFPIHLIPNGIDSFIFQPRAKRFSRALFNIPQNKIVLLFVAESLTNLRKGMAYLNQAFGSIKRKDVVLCAIGSNAGQIHSPCETINLGMIYDELLMSVVYSAADVFIIPSLIDNLPNTIIESLMCGTPVIGFPVGGILDLIKDGINGYLTEEISVLSLKNTINKYLENPALFDNEKIRNDALKKYNLSIQAGEYVKLFNKTLNDKA